MVLLELSVVPTGVGASVSAYVADCIDVIDRTGLPYEVHSMGTIVEGELDEVLSVMRDCVEVVARQADRVSCTAKLDFRRGQTGRLRAKVDSVQRKFGRPLGRSSLAPPSNPEGGQAARQTG